MYGINQLFCYYSRNRNKNIDMLGTRDLGTSKSQSSIRHQVRKLRAKVKALIPSQMCNHFEKRNQQVEKINFRRAEHIRLMDQNSNTESELRTKPISNTVWKFGGSKPQQYHISTDPNGTAQCKHKKYEFQRLKPQQIEQINEDKIYYLGEKNVEAYDQYLKELKSKIYIDTFQSSTLIKTMKESYMNAPKDRVSRQVESVSLWDASRSKVERSPLAKKHKSSLKAKKLDTFFSNELVKDRDNPLKLRNSSTSITKWNSEGQIARSTHRTDSINEAQKKSLLSKPAQKRREEIDQEQRQKRIYQRIKMDMQMAKAEANQREIKYKQFSKLKEIQNEEKEKHERTVKKKSILMKKGEIVKFNEELRTLMIKRKNWDHLRSNSCVFEGLPISGTEL